MKKTTGYITASCPLSQLIGTVSGSIYHLDCSVSANIHGDNDGIVPLDWSLDLCERLESPGKAVECFTCPGQPHTFRNEGDQLFIQRMIDFFDSQGVTLLTG